MLKYYKLPSLNGEGWAHIMINTETGFFSTASDWGDYVHMWAFPGMEFRAFLMKLAPDYLFGKLMMGRASAKVFDAGETITEIHKALAEHHQSFDERHHMDWKDYDREFERAKEIRTEHDFEAWCSETVLDEPWLISCWLPDRDCTNFCTKVYPRFAAMLKAELAAEDSLPAQQQQQSRASG